MKVYLDNILVVDSIGGLFEPKLSYQIKDETGEIAFGYSDNLEFIGTEYTYLYDKLVTNGGVDSAVELKFVDECCSPPLVYTFNIKRENIEWCSDTCAIRATAVEKSVQSDYYTCLLNNTIANNMYGFQNHNHPRFSYCHELRPDWVMYTLIILNMSTWYTLSTVIPTLILVVSIIFAIVAPLILLLATVNLIIDAINALGGSMDNIEVPVVGTGSLSDISTSFSDFQNSINTWYNYLSEMSTGCGRKKPSPLVRDYADNICKVCNLNFSSSIINNPSSDYYNLCYFYSPLKAFVDYGDTTTYWIPENEPSASGIQFFKDLGVIFNAKFYILGNTLYFERKDHDPTVTEILNVSTYPKEEIISLCYEWSNKTPYAYAEYNYFQDAQNYVGGEAKGRWSDIVEWNNPYSNMQKGKYEPFIPFASCRFRNDKITDDILGHFSNLPIMASWLNSYSDSVIMNNDYCGTPMLLIWNGQSRDNAKCINGSDLSGAPALEYYNYPMFFNQSDSRCLYQRFHYIENPRISNYKGLQFTLKIKMNCTILQNLSIYNYVTLPEGKSKYELSYEIDYKRGIITIKGTV